MIFFQLLNLKKQKINYIIINDIKDLETASKKRYYFFSFNKIFKFIKKNKI